MIKLLNRYKGWKTSLGIGALNVKDFLVIVLCGLIIEMIRSVAAAATSTLI